MLVLSKLRRPKICPEEFGSPGCWGRSMSLHMLLTRVCRQHHHHLRCEQTLTCWIQCLRRMRSQERVEGCLKIVQGVHIRKPSLPG